MARRRTENHENDVRRRRHVGESHLSSSAQVERFTITSTPLVQRPTDKRVQLPTGQVQLTGSVDARSAASTRQGRLPTAPSVPPASNTIADTPGWGISDFPPLHPMSNLIGRERRETRGYTSILEPNLRKLTLAAAIWAEKTILFDDAFPQGDELVNFWDNGCWVKAQQQLQLDERCTKKCRRVVRTSGHPMNRQSD